MNGLWSDTWRYLIILSYLTAYSHQSVPFGFLTQYIRALTANPVPYTLQLRHDEELRTQGVKAAVHPRGGPAASHSACSISILLSSAEPHGAESHGGRPRGG